MSYTLKRGLDDVYVAEVTADTSTAYTVGTPKKLMPAGEMSATVDKDSANYWFDNGVFAIVGREGGTELTISGAGMRPVDIADLIGKTVDTTTGAMIDDGAYHEKYWALGARKKNIDGTFEYFWFLKGSFSIPDESAKTEGEDTDATGTELTYTAVQTVHVFEDTGAVCKRVVIDTETTTFMQGKTWSAQVVTPDNLATIVAHVV